MNKEQQINLITEWLKKFDLPKDSIDLNAEIDSKLPHEPETASSNLAGAIYV
jgi:hypothetical protein